VGFRIAPHPHLVRRGQDLLYELAISVPQAVLGDRITVPTVNGEHQVDVAPGTQHGKVLKISGMGVPHVRSGRRGDQLCVIHVAVPTHLTGAERELYKQLGKLEGKTDEVTTGFLRPARHSRQRFGLGDTLHALLGFAFAGQRWIEKYVGHSADGDCDQEEDSENLHTALRLGSHGVVAGV
jgi:hypothetical protein